MKKQPVITTSAPSYPTIDEVKTASATGKIIKSVAVTALVASTVLAATGCFEPFYTPDVMGETTILMGETTGFTDYTDYTE